MKWEEFRKRQAENIELINREKTEIECPLCGKCLWKRLDIVLSTYPPQFQYECVCGWVGYAFN